jgi:hypothetical protein
VSIEEIGQAAYRRDQVRRRFAQKMGAVFFAPDLIPHGYIDLVGLSLFRTSSLLE